MKTNRQKLAERLKRLYQQGGSFHVSWAPDAAKYSDEKMAGDLLGFLDSVEAKCPHGHKIGNDFEKYDDCDSPLKCPTDVHGHCEGFAKGHEALKRL